MTAVPPGGRIVVTGANGFVGGHAVRQFRDAGFEVVPLAGGKNDLTLAWPKLGRVDGVLHLAGLAAVGPSFDDPQRYIETNSSMVTHLCEALLRDAEAAHARVLVISTGAVYGSADGPVSEQRLIDPTSPYAISKILVETQVRYYARRGLDMVIARPFNHIGPGQGPGFIVPDIAARARAHEQGTVMSAGNLDSRRDYTDVRDVVRAYLALLTADRLDHLEYNVGSGEAHSGWEILSEISLRLGIPQPEVQTSAERRLDPDTVIADASRLRQETGWVPTVSFAQSIADFLA